MCGIAGYVLKNQCIENDRVISEMTRSMLHRGPDDGGVEMLGWNHDYKNIAIGHRRLNIIDLSFNSHQPMVNERGNIWVIFNGEIFNYIEIRNKLQSKGVVFKSSGDTEVVIKAYEEWGESCFSHFNGMWGIAIIDVSKKKVILSRDRFGEKPLYYYISDNVLVFGSEIKSILKHPDVSARPNYRKIYRNIALWHGLVDYGEETYFEDIYEVPKSSYMKFDAELNCKTEKYWELQSNNLIDITDDEAIKRYKELLFDSVGIRLRSDVPIGCMLSGGMDSTSTAAIASNVFGKKISTFSVITGDEKGVYDESEYIDAVVNDISSDHHYLKVRPQSNELFNVVNEMLNKYDEPICTVTWYTLYLVDKLIHEKGLKVVLTGMNSDEINGGYWDHFHYNFYDMLVSGDIKGFDHEYSMWKKHYCREDEEVYKSIAKVDNIRNNNLNELNYFIDYSKVFTSSFLSNYKNSHIPSYDCANMYTNKMRTDLDRGISVMTKPEDRNTMAHSIESRSAFYDYRLAEFTYSLPNKFRIRDGVGKWLLRESMKGILPDKVINRKEKVGLNAPADMWYRTTNKNDIYQIVNSERFKKRKIYDVDQVVKVIDDHMYDKNHYQFIWQLINTEYWFRNYID